MTVTHPPSAPLQLTIGVLRASYLSMTSPVARLLSRLAMSGCVRCVGMWGGIAARLQWASRSLPTPSALVCPSLLTPTQLEAYGTVADTIKMCVANKIDLNEEREVRRCCSPSPARPCATMRPPMRPPTHAPVDSRSARLTACALLAPTAACLWRLAPKATSRSRRCADWLARAGGDLGTPLRSCRICVAFSRIILAAAWHLPRPLRSCA